MREIKFRQRNKNNGQFHYWGVVDGDWVDQMKTANYVQPEESDQYTGLKDKNGTEIYEGDVLRFPKLEFNCQVVWSAESGSWDIEFIDKPTWSDDNLAEHAGKISIIGNILQNPELLK